MMYFSIALASASSITPFLKAPSTYLLREVTDSATSSAASLASPTAVCTDSMAALMLLTCSVTLKFIFSSVNSILDSSRFSKAWDSVLKSSYVTRRAMSSAMTLISPSYFSYIFPVSESTYVFSAFSAIISAFCVICVCNRISASARASLKRETPYIKISPVKEMRKSPCSFQSATLLSFWYSSVGWSCCER